MARVPRFFREGVALEIGGVDETQPSQSLEPSSLEVKDPKYQQKKTLVQVPKYLNPDSVSRHQRWWRVLHSLFEAFALLQLISWGISGTVHVKNGQPKIVAKR